MEKKNHTLKYIKRQAKKLKKEQGIPHTQALEIVSKSHGYSNWMHYQRSFGQDSESKIKATENEQQPSFTEWLKKHTKRNSPLGDLACDVANDPDWPHSNKKGDFLDYFSFIGASAGAREALNRGWKSYNAYLRNLTSPKIRKPKKEMLKPSNFDARKIEFVKNIKPIPFPDRSIEKFNIGDKAWISWNGSKAIPVTIVEILDEHYKVRIERPQKKAGQESTLFLDEVRSSPKLACLNNVTF